MSLVLSTAEEAAHASFSPDGHEFVAVWESIKIFAVDDNGQATLIDNTPSPPPIRSVIKIMYLPDQ